MPRADVVCWSRWRDIRDIHHALTKRRAVCHAASINVTTMMHIMMNDWRAPALLLSELNKYKLLIRRGNLEQIPIGFGRRYHGDEVKSGQISRFSDDVRELT